MDIEGATIALCTVKGGIPSSPLGEATTAMRKVVDYATSRVDTGLLMSLLLSIFFL